MIRQHDGFVGGDEGLVCGWEGGREGERGMVVGWMSIVLRLLRGVGLCG